MRLWHRKGLSNSRIITLIGASRMFFYGKTGRNYVLPVGHLSNGRPLCLDQIRDLEQRGGIVHGGQVARIAAFADRLNSPA